VLATCLNNCSGTQGGVCPYVRTETGTPIEACYTGDPTCEAICECQIGRYGEDCSLSESQMTQEIRLYRAVLCGMKELALTNTSSVSDASVESWVAILDTLSVHSFPLVPASADCVIDAIDTILDLARTRDIYMSEEYATTLLSRTDIVFRFPDFFDYPLLTQEYKESLVTSLGDMVSGQFFYESVRAGIRMTIIIPNIEDGNATLAIDLPQSELESFAQEPTSNLRSISLPSGSGYCVVSYQAQVYKSFSLEMSSNAIALYGSDTAQSSNITHITVSVALPHVAGFEYGMLYNASQVTVNCSAGQNASKVVICPDGGSNYTVPCGNASGTWDVTCPASYLVPTCNLLDGVVERALYCSFIPRPRDFPSLCAGRVRGNDRNCD
jgi:hypothetical protein